MEAAGATELLPGCKAASMIALLAISSFAEQAVGRRSLALALGPSQDLNACETNLIQPVLAAC
jgi:hypothetical protein